MSTQRIVLNFILFQLGWFACVLGAANQLPWLAFVIAVSLVSIQLAFIPNPMKELQLILMVTVVGAIFDQLLLNHGVVHYQANGWSPALVPIWIIGLWVAFASTLNVSMRWLRNYRLLAILFGAIGGPLAFMAAEKLGAVTLTITPSSHIVLAIGWGAMMPLMMYFSKKFDGYAHI
jgi:Protein of unknown function (DUF2878)